MKKLLVIAAMVGATGIGMAQQSLSGAWFLEPGYTSKPVVLVQLGTMRNVLSLRDFDLQINTLLSPIGSVKIGGAITTTFKIADNADFAVGLGVASRVGIVIGITIRS